MMLDLILAVVAVAAICWAVNRHTKLATLTDAIAVLKTDATTISDAVGSEIEDLHAKIDAVIPIIKDAAKWVRAEIAKLLPASAEVPAVVESPADSAVTLAAPHAESLTPEEKIARINADIEALTAQAQKIKDARKALTEALK